MTDEIEETGDARPDHYSQKEGSIECIAAIEQLCDEHQNDCLLYTSPSPRDKRQSRMPSSA